MQYRGPAEGTTRAVRLDAMTALFDRRSGMTHVVAEPVPTILGILSPSWAGLDDVVIRLGGVDERAALVERLDELAEAGLVEAQ